MSLIKLILPGERVQSWNLFYAGTHWTKRQAEAERVHMVVRSALSGNETPFRQPVDIQLIAYFDKRPLDASNIFLKPYEDALKGWLIVDDSPKYVRSVQTVSLIDKSNPRVEIILSEAI